MLRKTFIFIFIFYNSLYSMPSVALPTGTALMDYTLTQQNHQLQRELLEKQLNNTKIETNSNNAFKYLTIVFMVGITGAIGKIVHGMDYLKEAKDFSCRKVRGAYRWITNKEMIKIKKKDYEALQKELTNTKNRLDQREKVLKAFVVDSYFEDLKKEYPEGQKVIPKLNPYEQSVNFFKKNILKKNE